MHYFVVFGNPIAHSKSPILYNAFFERLQLGARYTQFLLKEGESPVAALRAHGFSGANVTIPFKEIAFAECDEVRGVAREIGSVNTIVREGERVVGYNTDAEGFYRVIAKRFIPKNALLIGAGGSAKAIAYILRQHQIPTTIVNRSQARLQPLTSAGYKTMLSEALGTEDSFDLIVNATSAGLTDDSLPLPIEKMTALLQSLKAQPQSLLVDIVYGQTTPLFALAQSLGIQAVDGLEMLLTQAALAATHFFDIIQPNATTRIDKDEAYRILRECAPI